MVDVLNDLRKDLEKRLKDLAPMVEEHAHVRAALDALKDTGTQARRSAATAAHTAASAVRRSPASKNGTGSRGRARGGGARALEALRHVHGNPGITIGELATKMKIKPNYLYRVLPQLQREGKVRKDGSGYHAAEAASPGGDTPKPSRRRARKT